MRAGRLAADPPPLEEERRRWHETAVRAFEVAQQVDIHKLDMRQLKEELKRQVPPPLPQMAAKSADLHKRIRPHDTLFEALTETSPSTRTLASTC
jgi:hypothetical protein